jgi:hypothetical protein
MANFDAISHIQTGGSPQPINSREYAEISQKHATSKTPASSNEGTPLAI